VTGRCCARSIPALERTIGSCEREKWECGEKRITGSPHNFLLSTGLPWTTRQLAGDGDGRGATDDDGKGEGAGRDDGSGGAGRDEGKGGAGRDDGSGGAGRDDGSRDGDGRAGDDDDISHV
jgi:hypothetical protein